MNSWESILLTFLQHQTIFGSIFILFIEEAGFPLSVADIVITFTGYQIANGSLSFSVAFLGLLVADLAGASVLYYLSARFGQKLVFRFGKYIHLDEKKLLKVEEKFRKHGPLFIIFGRHIPGFRITITVFSGISDVTYQTFIISTFASVVWWIPFYLFVGQRLGPKAAQFFHAHSYSPLLLIFLPILALVLPLFLLRKKKKSNSLDNG